MAFQFQDFKISKEARSPHYLVVGHPVGHSLSPEMHRTALKHHNIEADYHGVDIQTDQIPEFAAWCNRDEFLGCNVTIPYKHQFMDLVDEIDSVAREIGVINTIVKKDHKLLGYNTDAYGFHYPLRDFEETLDQGGAVIFGTGGASKAIAYALENTGIEELIFVSRNPQRAVLPENISVRHRVVDYNQWQEFAGEATLFVNCTPVGMYPNINDTFLRDEDFKCFEDKICYDLIYNPPETEFLKQAARAGADCINGLPMLIHQGSRSFELWTGKTFPVKKIEQTLRDSFR